MQLPDILDRDHAAHTARKLDFESAGVVARGIPPSALKASASVRRSVNDRFPAAESENRLLGYSRSTAVPWATRPASFHYLCARISASR